MSQTEVMGCLTTFTLFLSLPTLDDLDEIRGVLRSFFIQKSSNPNDLSHINEKSLPAVPEFFHVNSNFIRPELEPSTEKSFTQTIEAYFMVRSITVSNQTSSKTRKQIYKHYLLKSARTTCRM